MADNPYMVVDQPSYGGQLVDFTKIFGSGQQGQTQQGQKAPRSDYQQGQDARAQFDKGPVGQYLMSLFGGGAQPQQQPPGPPMNISPPDPVPQVPQLPRQAAAPAPAPAPAAAPTPSPPYYAPRSLTSGPQPGPGNPTEGGTPGGGWPQPTASDWATARSSLGDRFNRVNAEVAEDPSLLSSDRRASTTNAFFNEWYNGVGR
jgi:hypothetical protein